MKSNININMNAGLLGGILGAGFTAAAAAGFAGGIYMAKNIHKFDGCQCGWCHDDDETEDEVVETESVVSAPVETAETQQEP